MMEQQHYYKHKLNMLEPGIIMMKIIGVLFVSGFVFWVAKWHWLSVIFWCLSGIIFAVLLILVAIEAHQDHVLNDIAMRENSELGKKYETKFNLLAQLLPDDSHFRAGSKKQGKIEA